MFSSWGHLLCPRIPPLQKKTLLLKKEEVIELLYMQIFLTPMEMQREIQNYM